MKCVHISFNFRKDKNNNIFSDLDDVLIDDLKIPKNFNTLDILCLDLSQHYSYDQRDFEAINYLPISNRITNNTSFQKQKSKNKPPGHCMKRNHLLVKNSSKSLPKMSAKHSMKCEFKLNNNQMNQILLPKNNDVNHNTVLNSPNVSLNKKFLLLH